MKLFLEVGNDKYIIMCKFGGRIIRGFEIIGGHSASRLNNSPWGLSVRHYKSGCNVRLHLMQILRVVVQNNHDIK